MTTSPVIYADWVVLLDRFGSGEDEVVPIMQQGSIEWTNVVAERWTQQVAWAFKTRIEALSQLLQIALQRVREPADVANAMILARRGLAPLQAFIRIEAIPEQVKDNLAAALNGWVTGTQENLELGAESLRHTDYGRLLKTFRDHPLGAGIFSAEAEVPTSSTPEANPPSHRRIILS